MIVTIFLKIKNSMAILSESQLKRLKEHKYASEGRTCTDFIFQHWWNAVIEWMPLWLAPNLITLSGLVLNCVSCFLIIGNSMQAKSNDVPPTYFLLTALCLFIYQTLDAIDGKQARRTGTSSPLGELFDHGCDCVSTIVISLAMACTLSLGTYPNFLFYFFLNNIMMFYLAHWQTYCRGCLIFGSWDVTEVQLTCMASLVFTSFVGPDYHNKTVEYLPYGLSINKYTVIFLAFGAVVYSYKAMTKILSGGVGKNGTTVACTSVISPIVPVGVVICVAFYVFKHSVENLFVEYPVLFMLMFGTASTKITCNIIVASMSKSHLDMLDFCMLGPAVLCMFIYFGIGPLLVTLFNIHISEYSVLLLAFVFNVVHFCWYCISLCVEISEYFGIAVLTIPHPKKEK